MKTVKVARVGGMVVEVAVENNATIKQCITAAGLAKRENEEIYENHAIVADYMTALSKGVIILEEKKTPQVSEAMKKVIDFICDSFDPIDLGEYYMDNDNDEVDYNEILFDFPEIEQLIRLAKEV